MFHGPDYIGAGRRGRRRRPANENHGPATKCSDFSKMPRAPLANNPLPPPGRLSARRGHPCGEGRDPFIAWNITRRRRGGLIMNGDVVARRQRRLSRFTMEIAREVSV